MVEPKKLQEIHDEIAPELSYEPFDLDDWELLAPSEVKESGKGNCLDVSLLALDTAGEGDLLYAEKPNGEGHSVPVFTHDSGLYWVELLDKSGVYGPFKDMSEVMKAFLETYSYPEDTHFCSITYDDFEDSIGEGWDHFDKTLLTPECTEKYSNIPIYKFAQGRDSEFEKKLLQEATQTDDFGYLVDYALNYIKGRWPEAEPYILKSPSAAGWYAHEVIEGPWPEAESIIMTSPQDAADYARLILKRRWPEAESIIAKNPLSAYFYTTEVLMDRWPEAEETMKAYPDVWEDYLEFLKPKGLHLDTWRTEEWG